MESVDIAQSVAKRSERWSVEMHSFETEKTQGGATSSVDFVLCESARKNVDLRLKISSDPFYLPMFLVKMHALTKSGEKNVDLMLEILLDHFYVQRFLVKMPEGMKPGENFFSLRQYGVWTNLPFEFSRKKMALMDLSLEHAYFHRVRRASTGRYSPPLFQPITVF